ncbi:DedA family protein [Caldichromatium japonicum]|uniref:DedA family protein n=1 Tax=Caldichromatium japonicum TaxID=2699430 RepID=A0A6G7VFM8_9GAMM|nr:DedA family protein [Caldichromatium japonicum]QIK38710.1 DedA family protein [Caldichromatium japonicum]
MISHFIVSYGYLAVFAGTLLEGETILIAAGFAAHRGLLDWPLVALTATIGGALGDQLFFALGRWKGDVLIQRFPALTKHRLRVHDLLERHSVLVILIVRFLYGLRIAGPLLLGSSRVPVLRFVVLNLIGAALWAIAVSGAGYVFGLALSALINDLKRVEEIVLVAILAAGGLTWFKRKTRK